MLSYDGYLLCKYLTDLGLYVYPCQTRIKILTNIAKKVTGSSIFAKLLMAGMCKKTGFFLANCRVGNWTILSLNYIFLKLETKNLNANLTST